MKIIYNKIIPFKGFSAMNFFGILFARKDAKISEKTINHERIHTEQYKELGFIGFLPIYLVEWFVKLFVYGFRSKEAYKNISFEREAYENQGDFEYTKTRKRYTWIHRISK